MRLIDVSKLKKIRIEHQRSVYSHGRIEGYNACIEDLENQPEVKAIPIEWLYQKRTLYLENKCYMSLMVINEILNWWEKENEIDRP